MTRIGLLNSIQDRAVQAIVDNDWVGSAFMSMGSGKTFVFFKLLYKALEHGLIDKGDDVLFWAETRTRAYTTKEEAEKFGDIYGVSPYEDFNIINRCYQSGRKGKFDHVKFEGYDK